MKEARQIVLSLAPPGFSISLSSCYNYTENYRKGSIQSKRHHSGQGVNAQLSLRRPPRTGVERLVVNLHWSTANVNYTVDAAQESSSLVISKDAKAIIPGDIAPVQHPGHSWKKRDILPDHTWDQSRTNAVTPMTFLFLETKITGTATHALDDISIPVSSTTLVHLTRTGQGVTLLNLSFFEPDTTFKCLNELFLLLSLPSLDSFFRSRLTGALKKEFTFIVDNGPAEQPSSPLVRMCLVRLLRFLNLEKVTQISFAEYHSKRNYVERVHAEENRVLSKHGIFKSNSIHSNATVGSVKHRENMESMASKVMQCIRHASFGGKPLLCYRGIKKCDFLFDDEDTLHTFLSLSEEKKQEFPCTMYKVRESKILDEIKFAWNVDPHFKGCYIEDYKLLQNELIEERTCWTDKYTTVVYSPTSDIKCKRNENQPLPDYIRWLNTHELHYLPYKERVLLAHGEWDEEPGIYIPTRVLDICYLLMPDPPPDVMTCIALLAWVTVAEAKDYYKKIKEHLDDTARADEEKERWKNHKLYRTQTKLQLEALCKSLKIPVTPVLSKHHLVSLISEKKGESYPQLDKPLYSGKLIAVPSTVNAISRLTVGKLRAILRFHGFSTLGSKDQLVLRVLLLRQGCTASISIKEEQELKHLIKISQRLLFAQRSLNLSSHVYYKRTYTSTTTKSVLSAPLNIRTEEDLTDMFTPLLNHIVAIQDERKAKDERTTVNLIHVPSMTEDNDTLKEQIAQVGARVKVKWTADDIGDSGWKPGWYTAHVQGYDCNEDIITLQYPSEPDCTYIVELTPMLTSGIIKLVEAVL